MSPDIRIYDPIGSAIEATEKSRWRKNPTVRLNLSDVSQEVPGNGGIALHVNMDGINGNRAVQHLVLDGPLVGERISLTLDNVTGEASRILTNGRRIDVLVPKALVQTPRKVKGPKPPKNPEPAPRPYEWKWFG
jgi:hypothetical protein